MAGDEKVRETVEAKKVDEEIHQTLQLAAWAPDGKMLETELQAVQQSVAIAMQVGLAKKLAADEPAPGLEGIAAVKPTLAAMIVLDDLATAGALTAYLGQETANGFVAWARAFQRNLKARPRLTDCLRVATVTSTCALHASSRNCVLSRACDMSGQGQSPRQFVQAHAGCQRALVDDVPCVSIP